MTFQDRSFYGQYNFYSDGRAKRGLTQDEVRRMAPSVFATTAHASRSDRFAPIPTWDIVQRICEEGFVLVGAKQSTARDVSKTGFTKHMLCFQPREIGEVKVGGTIQQALLVNANDGSSGYKLLSGAFRVQCLNSLVMPIRSDSEISIRHSGKDVMGKVIDATYEVIETAKQALEAPKVWSQINLTAPEAEAFAEAARVVRFGDAEGNVDSPITASQLLRPRREEDRGADLWLTFNRIQENAIRGGLTAIRRNAETGARRRVTTRGVQGIDGDVKVNRALWMLAEKLAELKS